MESEYQYTLDIGNSQRVNKTISFLKRFSVLYLFLIRGKITDKGRRGGIDSCMEISNIGRKSGYII